MAKLSTHVLDTVNGVPARGIRIDFEKLTGKDALLVKTVTTNADGRTDELLLDADTMETGEYQLLFYVGEYFSKKQGAVQELPFLNHIPIRFVIADATQNYHVPILVSPWSYTTYRGS